jgi:hypothetical protein
MVIEIKKFGKLLVSRPAGKEAASIILSSFIPPTSSELIELDFSGVDVVAPSWLDEVLTLLRDQYGKRVVCLKSENLSLRESLKIIEALDDQQES